MTPWQKYQQDLTRDDFHYDPHQEQAVRHLQRLYNALQTRQERREQAPKGLFGRLKERFSGPSEELIQGIYFWGGVGRGKTYLVDAFYDCLPDERKLRLHFHRFMLRVHESLASHAGKPDPLELVAAELADEAEVICFDEFFVSDITDAMLLAGLFKALFERHVVLVATSNVVPDRLYENGLQRARFLPAIDLLKEYCEVVEVGAGTDFRMRTLSQAELYHSPLDPQASDNMQRYFTQLAPEAGHGAGEIQVLGRAIPVMNEADSVLMVDFHALCDGPRSQRDYVELSRLYHTVLLANVSQMNDNHNDMARRFIALIDEFYERNVTLIISAEAPMEALYQGEGLAFEFKRCLSRLQEMQSEEFLGREHLP